MTVTRKKLSEVAFPRRTTNGAEAHPGETR